jgi:hypothetical protein
MTGTKKRHIQEAERNTKLVRTIANAVRRARLDYEGNSSRRRRARILGIGAAAGGAAGAILGRGSSAAAGTVIGGIAGALTPTRRRR